MFTESCNYAIVRSCLDQMFDLGSSPGVSHYDFDYENYNRLRLEKYEREDRDREFINRVLGFAMVVCVILLIVLK